MINNNNNHGRRPQHNANMLKSKRVRMSLHVHSFAHIHIQMQFVCCYWCCCCCFFFFSSHCGNVVRPLSLSNSLTVCLCTVTLVQTHGSRMWISKERTERWFVCCWCSFGVLCCGRPMKNIERVLYAYVRLVRWQKKKTHTDTYTLCANSLSLGDFNEIVWFQPILVDE